MVYARAKAQEAGYGLETELAEPDGALVSAAAAARRGRSKALQKPLAALARRLEAVLEDAPDWLDAQARARVEGAIRGLSWRRETLAAWVALLGRGSAARPIPSSSTGWRSSGSTGANIDVAIHRRWLDPTKPLAASRPGAGGRRARHLGDACAAARTGRRPKRAPARCTSPRPAGISRRKARSITPAAPKC